MKAQDFCFIALATLLIGTTSCNRNSKEVVVVYDTIDNELPSLIQDSVANNIVYAGKLPCADCPGIQTELTLYPDSLNFQLSQLYLERSDKPEFYKGKYEMIGDSSSGNSTIYHLSSGNDKWHFRSKGDSVMLMLDQEMHEISSDLNYALRKK